MPTKDISDATTQPALTPVTSATQGAYNAIRRMILVGDLRPGEKLKIDVLKARLDTGASPVREALSLLTSDQLVERIDQRGFRAAPASQGNFDEILKLRCALEDMALRQSIANATDSWEEQLVLSLHRMSRENSKTSETYEDLHKAFHMALLANCDSPILLKFCSQLYDLNVRYRYLAGRSLNYKSRHVGDEHAEILAAAVKRDVNAASECLLHHYQKTGAFLRQSDLVSES
jgi:DNA-binding GntR family transcriptional regulator